MAYAITEECIGYGACEPECPSQAIREGSDIYVIALVDASAALA